MDSSIGKIKPVLVVCSSEMSSGPAVICARYEFGAFACYKGDPLYIHQRQREVRQPS